MGPGSTLSDVLRADMASGANEAMADDIVNVFSALANSAKSLSELIARPAVEGRMGEAAGATNADGDNQRKLDIIAEDMFRAVLATTPIRAYFSEECEEPSVLGASGSLDLAIDPLDGSSNIDVIAPIGTIFSIFPAGPDPLTNPETAFRRTGRGQCAAGFFVYGSQTALVMSVGRGTHLLTLDRESGTFILVQGGLTIPQGVSEYAINASNYRHWHDPVQSYIDDCVLGADGPRGRNFNMRWIASLVADAYRIFVRGGVFLYPGDKRPGYEQGRLRLLYEANPIAFLAEQAGGAATDGLDPILDRIPAKLHERTPFVTGSADKVELIRRYHLDRSPPSRHAPLFGRRGLLRA